MEWWSRRWEKLDGRDGTLEQRNEGVIEKNKEVGGERLE